MIISGKQVQSVLKAYGEQSKAVKNTKTEKTGTVQKKDEVVLSSEGKEFAQILQSVKNLSDVREDKVKEIAQRIDSGNYQVDSKDVAEKIMKGALIDNMR
jgi:flagellar biosynthesis anti-sigma factor FlgM